MTGSLLLPIDIWFALAIGASLASAAISLMAVRRIQVMNALIFPLLSLAGIASAMVGASMLAGSAGFTAELWLGLPWMHWYLQVDPLSAMLLGLIGLVVFATSVYGPGYVRQYVRSGRYSLAVLGAATGLFVAGMQLVVVAGDALSFMIAWELMSVASYVLVAFEHLESANRRAAFLYLLMAQIGAVLILLAFGVLAAFADGFSFQAMRSASLPELWSTVAFVLALLGFGMKAGLVPIHIWLPEAHPVAPSYISALMSGVMLKVAVYGSIRFIFDLLGDLQWEWGVILLVAGSISALYGVLYALIQHDLKRLLAYHSVENIGIIYIGLGLSVLFFASGFPKLGALGLVAALYHTINHAVFKSLLFLGAGAIAQHGGERDLERMGGLIRRMPWTALFFLIGCISISALPPFNGFVSEWLTLQAALQATSLDSGVLRAVIPIAAAILALTGALAAACFVKVYGVAFLGRARARRVRHAREASPGMIVAQAVLAVLCLVLGVFSATMVEGLSRVSETLTGAGLATATGRGWLWLTPISPETASYSAPLVMAAVTTMIGVWGVIHLVLRRRRISPVPRRDAWDCGYGSLSSRMQYSATAFAMPIRQVFRPIFHIREEFQREMDTDLPTRAERLRYHLHVEDASWRLFYRPVERAITWCSRLVSRIQTGHLRHYLAYSFFTILLLLWLMT